MLERHARLMQVVRNFDRRQYTNNAIESATSGDCVGVRTNEQWLLRGHGTRAATDEILRRVNLGCKTRCCHLLGEPDAGLPIPGCKGTTCPARLIGITERAQARPVVEQTLRV